MQIYFEQVQVVLEDRGRPDREEYGRWHACTSLIECGECGKLGVRGVQAMLGGGSNNVTKAKLQDLHWPKKSKT